MRAMSKAARSSSSGTSRDSSKAVGVRATRNTRSRAASSSRSIVSRRAANSARARARAASSVIFVPRKSGSWQWPVRCIRRRASVAPSSAPARRARRGPAGAEPGRRGAARSIAMERADGRPAPRPGRRADTRRLVPPRPAIRLRAGGPSPTVNPPAGGGSAAAPRARACVHPPPSPPAQSARPVAGATGGKGMRERYRPRPLVHLERGVARRPFAGGARAVPRAAGRAQGDPLRLRGGRGRGRGLARLLRRRGLPLRHLARASSRARSGCRAWSGSSTSFGIRTSWFIPGHSIETFPEECKLGRGRGPRDRGPRVLPREPHRDDPGAGGRRSSTSASTSSSACAARAPTGYVAPWWEFSPYTNELLLKRGIKYDHSLMNNDFHPFYVRVGDSWTKNRLLQAPERVDEAARAGRGDRHLIDIPGSWYLDDLPPMMFIKTRPEQLRVRQPRATSSSSGETSSTGCTASTTTRSSP